MQKNHIMTKTLTLLTFLIIASFSLNAQNDYNRTDNLGRRQGKWIDYHLNGNVRCKGEFKDNEPTGEFIYYSEGGEMIAKGKYDNKKKQGQWEYYSADEGSLILVENYKDGMIIGKTVAYSPITHNVIEEIEYVNNVKEGIFNKYYDNGRIMIKASYRNDKLDGNYIFYYPNTMPKEEGQYKEGDKVGEWKTYDMEGNIISVDKYDKEF